MSSPRWEDTLPIEPVSETPKWEDTSPVELKAESPRWEDTVPVQEQEAAPVLCDCVVLGMDGISSRVRHCEYC